jgi:signal transduction histidine kinase
MRGSQRAEDAGRVEVRFRRAMLPLAVLTGMLVSIVPPALTLRGALQRELAVAGRTAHVLATELSEVVARQPDLWRYNAPKLIDTARASGWLDGTVEVRVRLCSGAVVAGGSDPLAGRDVRGAAIERAGRAVGSVEVRSLPVQRTVLSVVWLSVPFGLGLGFVLWWVPALFVSRQTRSLGRALHQLEVEKAMVDALNDDLHTRVEEAMQDVRVLGERVLSVQDDERRRIARELHDGLGQSLTALRLSIERAPSEPREDLADLVGRAAVELRRSVHDLRPPDLRPDSLRATVDGIAEDFEMRTTIAVPRRWRGADLVPSAGALHVVRVLQEALQNAARHGRASEIRIDVAVDAATLTLRVEDDGDGLPTSPPRPGMGLSTMQDRVRLCDGEFRLSGCDEGGCVVEATFALSVIARPAVDGTAPRG